MTAQREAWTTPAQLRAQVERLWDQGRLLSVLAGGESPFPLRLTLRTPASADCVDHFEAVRAWAQSLGDGAHWRLELREWRHPVLGRNTLPNQVWIDNAEQAWRLLGKTAETRRFAQMVERTASVQPALLAWLRRRPLQALELAPAWDRLLLVAAWLQAHPRPGIYLRQVDLPGVDTKFIEGHRGVLVELLDLVLPVDAMVTDASGVSGFAHRYGFLDKAARVRLRSLDASVAPLGTGGCEDLTIDAATLARLDPPVSRVFITENEVNFLAFPPAPQSWILFGAGYGLDRLKQLSWLRDKSIHYWGDIDTHGFAILDELRAYLAQAKSFLMDRETLLAHRELWVEEPQPQRRDLPRLTVAERALYDDLRWQRLGGLQPRLEQERIGFGRVTSALSEL